MQARQHKLAAKKALDGNWGTAIGALLITGLLTSVVSGIINWSEMQYYWWIPTLLGIFLTIPIMVGYSWFHLELLRTNKASIDTLFDGFRKGYGRNVCTGTLMSIFIFLWSLLLIIPGVVKALSYSMTFYILRDHPELSAPDAIKASEKMMVGKKKDLFFLILSFIGWFILPYAITLAGVIIAGVGIFGGGIASLTALGAFCIIVGPISTVLVTLYVRPYYMTSIAAFYENYAKVDAEDSYSHAG